ncbi:hypothetical protein GCM10010975_13560 [Comamonas phosphati]|nr:hypothetical protein GCM10010975_13560 [Comamonas phosphati]
MGSRFSWHREAAARLQIPSGDGAAGTRSFPRPSDLQRPVATARADNGRLVFLHDAIKTIRGNGSYAWIAKTCSDFDPCGN